MDKFLRLALSPCNWLGLGLAIAVLVLHNLGYIGAWWGAVALGGYAVGFGVGAAWFGLPKLSGNPWDDLEFKDEGDARQAMMNALGAVRQLVSYNPESRLSKELQTRINGLCDDLEHLLAQWERSKGRLSLEESFHARHIALTYLPDALKSYLSIPARFASTKALADGQTAEQTFLLTLTSLNQKVGELTDDLAGQDADAFLVHSRFLKEKFQSHAVLDAPSLKTK